MSAPGCRRVHLDREACEFRVAWSINPHMRPGRACPRRAERQHRALLRAVRTLGACVEEVPFVHGAFDSVFAKDNAVLAEDGRARRALLGRPRHPERAQEQTARRHALERVGFSVETVGAARLEGGDVVLPPRGPALLGFGFRSSAAAIPALGDFLGREVLGLRLVDPRLYHLDTALGTLADGTVLACAAAFLPGALDQLANAPGVRDVLPVSLEAAMAFGLNFLEVDGAVVLARGAPEVDALLAALGRRVVTIDLSEFQIAGGSAACLCAPVHRLEARAPMLRDTG